jgi:hypothetical protein
MHTSGAMRREKEKVCVQEMSEQTQLVMPGLDPGIHQSARNCLSVMDCRVEPGNDG